MHLEERKRITERKKLQNLENLKQEVRSKVNKIRKDNENRLESIKNIKKFDRETLLKDYKSSQLMKLQLNSKTSDFRIEENPKEIKHQFDMKEIMSGDTDIGRLLHFEKPQMPKFSRRVQREKNKSENRVEMKEFDGKAEETEKNLRKRISRKDRKKERQTIDNKTVNKTPRNILDKLNKEDKAELSKDVKNLKNLGTISKSIDRLRDNDNLMNSKKLYVPSPALITRIMAKSSDLDNSVDDYPSAPNITVSKEIQNANLIFDDAFKYSIKDIELLSQHPLFVRRVTNWGENLTPEYLLDLK